MLTSIFKFCLATLLILSVVACEKDITQDELLVGTWHFTKWEGTSGSLLPEDLLPVLIETGDSVTRTRPVSITFRSDRYYEVKGHGATEEYDGYYRITNRGGWEGINAEISIGSSRYFDPWMEKLSDVLTSAHSYELEGAKLIIYDDNQRAFLYKQ